MHLRRCQVFRRRGAEPWETGTPRELGEEDRRAILAAAALPESGSADRGDLMLALRGSRASRLRAQGYVGGAGHGHFAGLEDEEVLARIDTLIAEGALRVERGEDGRVRVRPPRPQP